MCAKAAGTVMEAEDDIKGEDDADYASPLDWAQEGINREKSIKLIESN